MAKFDVARVNELLDIMLKTKDYPIYAPLQQLAHDELFKMLNDVQQAMEKEKEDAS